MILDIGQDLLFGLEQLEHKQKKKMIQVIRDNPMINRYDLWLDHFPNFAGSTIRNWLTDLMKLEIVISDRGKPARYCINVRRKPDV